ncbi:MAG: formylglycine-generating enzyme family protein [Verrucomicrobia bacterium]|nr:formylglycine-generating enzyme family protein [Verrucomicrobiota bacterium]
MRFLTAFFLLAAGSAIASASPEAPANAPGAETRVLETVFDLKRPGDADLLLLRNGEKLTGTISNQNFRLITAYTQLDLATRHIAGIDLERGFSSQEVVVTVNGNRFSGFLHEPAFGLRLENGQQIEVRREKVAKAIFRIRADESGTHPRSHLIRLRNGDVLSGSLAAAPVLEGANHEKPSFQFGDVETLALAPGELPRATARLRNGDSWQGILRSEEISLELDLGLRVQIYQGRISLIDGRPEALADLRTGRDAFHRVPEISSGSPQTASSGRSSQDRARDRDGLVWISPGTFLMGSPPDEADRGLDEGPQVKIAIAHGYWIGKCEVTQAQYRDVMGINPSHFTGDASRPVEKVSWQEALEYCARITALEQAAGTLPEGFAFRLPTEAEWEYACRAGTASRFSYGDDLGYSQLGSHAWFTGNSSSTTNPVGTRRPNPWGLHDMHGNVWEWCLDHWASAGPNEGSLESRNEQGSLRTARGGSWLYDGRFCRSANRDDYFKSSRCSDLGFRVVLAPLRP